MYTFSSPDILKIPENSKYKGLPEVKYADTSSALHYTHTFKMTTTEGSVGLPEISVDEYCEDVYETVTVDPSEDGVYEKQ